MSQRHRPRKRFGQHFLHDPGIIHRIVHAIAPQTDDHLVEIGPGEAAITRELLSSCARLDVVEIDRDLIPGLQALARESDGRLVVHEADALTFDVCALPDRPLRVVGNLPYNISTPLLFHLFERLECITDMHFMLQREVVERMAAGPGGRARGRLSVMCQYACEVVPLFHIDPGAFRPPPKVASAFVRLVPHRADHFPGCKKEALETIVSRAFGQRRKTLRNNLRGLIGADQIRSLGIDPGCRPETLEVEQFCRLSTLLSGKS